MNIPEITKEKTQAERIFAGDFSPEVSATFNSLQEHLIPQSMDKKSFTIGVVKGIFLRGLIKGLTRRKERKTLLTVGSKSENVLSQEEKILRAGSQGRAPFLPIPQIGRRNLHAFRLPAPSITALSRHVPFQKIEKVNGKHLQIFKLHMTGKYSRTQIAEMIGVSDPTVTNTLKNPVILEMKQKALQDVEEDYSSLLRPAVAAIRKGLKTGDLELRVKTAFGFLKTQGKGVSAQIQHKHEHEHAHIVTGSIEVEELKNKLLAKVGLDPKGVIEAEFKEVPA